ncbi:IS4 family transposase [Ktedonobacteria bacterium brp13]|nr:IS4 family transposase [Ktedonobacteria bacterium brp13]BCL79379.1 IS4 family transposase [Ktedonobacteria bacterium brp13]BCL79801.1 IS4 family transposase [Ktedonobacteria bacterium brp13]BCL79942.1 IS4 family transposase [Ktedonobacteria bacterium brp13]BCL80787.1 IS4 family transposase [Ktedonobacteria bacterium brp13]
MYRLLNEPDVTFAELIQPHVQQTKEQANTSAVTLLVQDTTDIDLSHRHKISGVGQIGNERGRGFFVQTVLAVCPHPEGREVLGCLAQEPFVRVPAPKGEQRHQRLKREERETDVWMRQVLAIGTPDPGKIWVHVGDRGADMFPFFQTCQQTKTHFLVRAAQNRRIEHEDEEIAYSLMRTRSWLSQASRPFEIPARHGHQARETQLQMAFGQMTLLPPRNEPQASQDPMPVWVVRVWEEHAPEGEKPLEWVLLTSVPTTTMEQAWERVEWYKHRWLVEDYHQCLKSGCRIEERQLQQVDSLIRLLGFLSPLAIRLLQVRELARVDPERLASEVIDPLMLAVLAERSDQSPTTMTLSTFWIEIARLGGYLARASDGPPGWRTIWKGWLFLQTLLEGVQLAFHLRL